MNNDNAQAEIGEKLTLVCKKELSELPRIGKLKPPHLNFTSLYSVNEICVDGLIEEFESNWPSVTIEWPTASDQVIELINQTIGQFDEQGSQIEGAASFIERARAAVAGAVRARKEVERNLPNLVKRTAHYKTEGLRLAIKGHLLLANFKIHDTLFYLSSWNGLQKLGKAVPKSISPFRATSDEVYAKLLGASPEKIYHGRLGKIGNYSLSGGYIAIFISTPQMISC